MEKEIRAFSTDLEKTRKELSDTKEKYDRAETRKKQTVEKATKTKPNFSLDNNAISLEIELMNEKLKNQYLLNAIR